jgi:hypothetical protein
MPCKCLSLLTGVLCLAVATLGVLPAPASAENLQVLVFKPSDEMEPNLYSLSREEYEPRQLNPYQHMVLTDAEIVRLQNGETIIVSDRVPEQGEALSAWGVAFSKASQEDLFNINADHANYTKNFPSFKELHPFYAKERGELIDAAHLLKKKGIFKLNMMLTYDYTKPLWREWRLLREDELDRFSEADQEQIKAWMDKNDFAVNQGGFYFVASDNPALGDYKTVVVRSAALQLTGFKARLKSPEKLKKDSEEDMGDAISELINLATKK